LHFFVIIDFCFHAIQINMKLLMNKKLYFSLYFIFIRWGCLNDFYISLYG